MLNTFFVGVGVPFALVPAHANVIMDDSTRTVFTLAKLN